MSNTQFRFDHFACEGDTCTVERNGYVVTATLVADTISTPTDCDCYSEEQIKAWRRDEWCFVGVVMSATYNGVSLGSHLASLWGVEANFPDSDNSYLGEVAEEMMPEVLAEAEASRHALIAQLTAEVAEEVAP